jgi:hypothetical protein
VHCDSRQQLRRYADQMCARVATARGMSAATVILLMARTKNDDVCNGNEQKIVTLIMMTTEYPRRT